MKAGLCLSGAVFLLAVSPDHVFAQSSTDSRIQRLEEAVRVLEGRVASLEAQLRDQSAPVRAAPANANWRRLQYGMAQRDVERVLGSPSKIVVNTRFIA